jgi:hypothetical protein
MYSETQTRFLREKANCIWWKTADEAMRRPDDIVLQIMNMGTTSDTGLLEMIFSKKQLAKAMLESRIGQLDQKSWSFWCRRLKLVNPLETPLPMPERSIGPDERVPRSVTDNFGIKQGNGKSYAF